MMKRASAILIIDRGLILATARKDNGEDFNLPGGKCEQPVLSLLLVLEPRHLRKILRAHDLHFVFERQDDIFIVKTFIPEKFYGQIPSDEEQKKTGEGRVRWITIPELLAGSFGEYNKNLLLHLKVIK